MKPFIYMDNAATTKVAPEVLESMMPYFQGLYGNPSSIYRFSSEGKKAVDEARDRIASALGAKSKEIFFTGGGSEGDNWAVKGVADAYKKKESISLRQRSSIMRSYTHASIWKDRDMKLRM